MPGRLLRLCLILARAFRMPLRALALLVVYPLYLLVTLAGMALDHVFFPGIRRVRIERPVFIVGHPRSGTTFLHRYLAELGAGTPFRVRDMLVPSLTLRALLCPLAMRLGAARAPSFALDHIHDTSLSSVETDDILLFLRHLDGLFYYVYFLGWDEREHPAYLDPAERPRRMSPRDMRWLKACYRRQLLGKPGSVPLGKFFSMPMRLEAVREAFPDARFICLVRDPLQSLPSSLSLVTNVLREATGTEPQAALKARYVERLRKASRALQAAFADTWRRGTIPESQMLLVRYEDLTGDFAGTMFRILDFLDKPPDEAMRREIERTAREQGERVSRHRYRLEQFGLTAAEVAEEFDFVYETFGVSRQPAGDPRTTEAPPSSS